MTFLEQNSNLSYRLSSDKRKPEAIQGRKVTDPQWMAGPPKSYHAPSSARSEDGVFIFQSNYPSGRLPATTMKPSLLRTSKASRRRAAFTVSIFGLLVGGSLLFWGAVRHAADSLPPQGLAPFQAILGLLLGLTGMLSGSWLRQRQTRMILQQYQEDREKYRQMAFYDQLTGLPNRSLLHDRLEQNLAEAQRFSHRLGVIFLDLDRFKCINDSMGHAAGDTLLKMAAERMQNCLRSNDTVARYAGDEFVVILSGFRTLQNLPGIVRKLMNTLSEPYPLPSHEVFTSASLGIALYPEDGTSAELLLRHADTAMYAAKEANGNTFRFFSREMERKLGRRLQLETSLRQALHRQQFCLLYQPQFDMRNGQLLGVEALVRWNHLELGLLTPDRFLDLAEETGLIIPLGNWILDQACRQWQQWKRDWDLSLCLAINLTSRQFMHDGLVTDIRSILAEHEVPGTCLELEITEGILMQNSASAGRVLDQLKELGVQLSIDDFGSGYFSLAYLQKLPIDRLKIDPSFVQGGPGSNQHASVVTTIIDLARNLNLQLIAEGVETADQIAFLLQQGCHIGQGYYFAEPLDADGIQMLFNRQLEPSLLSADPKADFARPAWPR